MSDETKQLKKSDFLAAVTEEPMTRAELVEALDEYQFISSYLDYLTDHFVDQGKVVRDDDGNIHRKVKKAAASREIFRVEWNEETGENEVVARILDATEYFTDDVKAEGWAQTPNAAVKKACSASFQNYKTECAGLRALVE